jgi:tetratricopeptide (TPR) repeat protein
MSLYSELKRRNVLRMAALYLVAAWLVMQVAEVITGLAGFPDWFGQTVLGILAIGFPIALLFSWFYELTPEGLNLEKDVEVEESITHITGRRMDFIVIAVLCAAVIVFAADKWWSFGPLESSEIPAELSVLIADFDNETGNDVFTGVLEKATSLVLEDASFVSIMRREAVLKAAEHIHPGATDIGQELSRLVARREGIHVVITGSITKSDENYVVSMSAIDVVSGDNLSHEQIETSSREQVLNVVGRLAGETRKKLGDTNSIAIRHAAEETFTASNLEAVHSYIQATELLTGGKWLEAAEEFIALAEENPEMGRAYAGAATALANMNRREEAAKYFNLAMSHVEHMTEREKFRTRGTYYLMTRNYHKASEVYENLVEAFPYDEVARVNLVLTYFYGRNMDHAVIAAREAEEAYPENAVAQANHGLIAMYAGDFETAKSRLEIFLDTNTSYETAYVGLALSQLALVEWLGAEQTYHKLNEVSIFGASLAAAGLADLALSKGLYSDACEILERAAAVDVENGDKAAAGRKLSTLAHAELESGRLNDAIAAAKRALDVSQQAPILFETARVLIGAGDQTGAAALASQLGERIAPEPLAYAKLIEGEIAMANGKARDAISLFNEAQAILDTWLGRVNLGRAYIDRREFLEAHAEFETALRRMGEAVSIFLDDFPTYYYLPPLHYWLGRSLEGLGSPAAFDSYHNFLEIKAEGEGDSLVTDARQRVKSF